MDPFEKIYTSREIADALPNLKSEGLMQNWFVRGVITLSDANPGRGKRRLYSFYEALQVAFVTDLTWSSEPTKIAGPIAKQCADFVAAWMREGKTIEELFHEYEYIAIYTVRGLVEDQVRFPRCEILQRSDFNIRADYTYDHFRGFDFPGMAQKLFENLESIMYNRRNK